MQYYHVVPFDFKAVFRFICSNMIHMTFFIVFQKILFYFASVCYHISNPNEAIMKQRYRQDCFNGGCDKWAELVDEATDGAVKIEVYPNSQLGAKADLIEMALAGQGVCTIADGSYLMDYVSDHRLSALYRV